MGKFFFHLYDDIDTEDVEGQEFSDLSQACAHAKSQVLNLIGETIKETGHLALHNGIDVEDCAGAVLNTVWFGDVVTLDQPLTAERHSRASLLDSGRVSAASRPANRDTLP